MSGARGGMVRALIRAHRPYLPHNKQGPDDARPELGRTRLRIP
ncbi:hypothetical protein [Acrocarpospora pleiomorpha]|nr:hypothetical protein [Acrocarpospora pleiomorpha]